MTMLDLMIDNDQVEHFGRWGYATNIGVVPVEQMMDIRRRLPRVLETPGPAGIPPLHRHLDDPLTYQLCALPAVVEFISRLIGPNVVLWHSRYFNKLMGDPKIPWHQDAPFWSISPGPVVSVWIALDRVNDENGCIAVLPGSQCKEIPHVESLDTGRFRKKADPAMFSDAGARSIHLQPGCALVFDRLLLHCSGVNETPGSRLALCARYTVPEVKIQVEKLRPEVSEYGVLLMKGEDCCGLNPRRVPPC